MFMVQVKDYGNFGEDLCGAGEVLQPRLPQRSKEKTCPIDLRSMWSEFPAEAIRAPQSSGVQTYFLLSRLLEQAPERGSLDDPAVFLLQKEFQEKKERCGEAEKEVSEGEIILLEGLLPGIPLYDLTVEGDHSFVASGLAIHNSHCRCRIYMRRTKLKERRSIARRQVTVDYALKQLRKVKERGLKFRPSFKPGSSR